MKSKQLLILKNTFMGQFSWMSSDTGEQIKNDRPNSQVVTMVYLDKFGDQKVVTENSYEGYGEFGGVDFYDAVAWMNPLWMEDTTADNNELRGHGIDIAFANENKGMFPNFHSLPERKFPQLYLNGKPFGEIDFTQEPESDPNQGWTQYSQDEDWD